MNPEDRDIRPASDFELDSEEEQEPMLDLTGSAAPSDVPESSAAGQQGSQHGSQKGSESDVFQFVSFDATAKVYVCLCCKDKNKKQTWVNRSTSNFRRHLTSQHADRYIPGNNRQGKLTHYGFKKEVTGKRKNFIASKFEKNDKLFADSKLVDWIVNASHSFRVVEQADFVEFCNALRPEYSLPTRNTVKNRILKRWEVEKAKVRQQMEKDLNNRRMGLTTDMWTSVAKRGYMVVTAHYIDNKWQMRSVIIAFKRVMYPHSGERLANHLLEAVQELSPKLLPSIWSITADNASTNPAMVTMIRSKILALTASYRESCMADEASAADGNIDDIESWQENQVFLIRCLAHVLQLAVREGLEAVPVVDAAIGHFRDLVKKITDSPKLLEALDGICSVLKVNRCTLQLDCPTRWNSTWDMIATVLKLRKPIEELTRRIRQRHDGYTDFSIGPDDVLAQQVESITWSALTDFCDFLKAFKEATVLMSASSYPTLGLVVPVMFLINKHVDAAMAATSGFTSTHAKKFAAAVKRKLDSYDDLVHSNEIVLAAALDPRVKSLLTDIGYAAEDVKKAMILEWDRYYSDMYTGEAKDDSKSSEAADSSSFLALLKNLPSQAANQGRDSQGSDEPFQSEIDRWFNHASMSLTQTSKDVCEWMRINQHLYPRICFMARDFLATTSTSVPSESAFSAAGTTIDKRRGRLGDDSVQAICELQSMIPFNAASNKQK